MPALDLNWVDTRNMKAQMKLEKLVKDFKSNSSKEAMTNWEITFLTLGTLPIP